MKISKRYTKTKEPTKTNHLNCWPIDLNIHKPTHIYFEYYNILQSGIASPNTTLAFGFFGIYSLYPIEVRGKSESSPN